MANNFVLGDGLDPKSYGHYGWPSSGMTLLPNRAPKNLEDITPQWLQSHTITDSFHTINFYRYNFADPVMRKLIADGVDPFTFSADAASTAFTNGADGGGYNCLVGTIGNTDNDAISLQLDYGLVGDVGFEIAWKVDGDFSVLNWEIGLHDSPAPTDATLPIVGDIDTFTIGNNADKGVLLHIDPDQTSKDLALVGEVVGTNAPQSDDEFFGRTVTANDLATTYPDFDSDSLKITRFQTSPDNDSSRALLFVPNDKQAARFYKSTNHSNIATTDPLYVWAYFRTRHTTAQTVYIYYINVWHRSINYFGM